MREVAVVIVESDLSRTAAGACESVVAQAGVAVGFVAQGVRLAHVVDIT
nr:hypothetical protein [Tanacetum cinerariifolium]